MLEAKLDEKSSIAKTEFGTTADNRKVYLYSIKNRYGLEVRIIDYGAILQSLFVPDKNGNFADVVLGYDRLSSYERDEFYFGGIIGRYANRIARGRFTLGGKTYQLAVNNGANHNHGGEKGFDKRLWQTETFENESNSGLLLRYFSRDGEENYPGNLNVEVKYSLTDDNELEIDYKATCDRNTIINLTNHAYFNLGGAGYGKNILDHELKIYSNKFTPLDQTQIPSGEFKRVKNTPFDFTNYKAIGRSINESDEQLSIGKGYDHNFVLDKKSEDFALAAEVFEPESGRRLQVLTTEPGLQFYTGNYLKNISGKNGKNYNAHDGFCLEAQHFPDSPNQSQFPSTILLPGNIYRQKTVYKFSVL